MTEGQVEATPALFVSLFVCIWPMLRAKSAFILNLLLAEYSVGPSGEYSADEALVLTASFLQWEYIPRYKKFNNFIIFCWIFKIQIDLESCK